MPTLKRAPDVVSVSLFVQGRAQEIARRSSVLGLRILPDSGVDE